MSEDTPQLQEKLSKLFARQQRRGLIRQHTSSSSLRETIGKVREAEKSVTGSDERAASLIRQLRESLVNIEPHVAAILEYGFEELRDRFPWVKAFVLLGSAAHGGAKARELAGSHKHSDDLDWGVIVDNTPLKESLIELDWEMRNLIWRLKDTHDPLMADLSESFNLCQTINPKLYNKMDYSLNQDFLDRTLMLENAFDLVFFFQPTFPPSVGERNQKLILQNLTELARADHQSWKRITVSMKKEWAEMHKIKPKHLIEREEVKRLGDSASMTARDLSLISLESFDKLLDQTEQVTLMGKLKAVFRRHR